LAVVGEKYHAFLLQATQIYPGQPCAVILIKEAYSDNSLAKVAIETGIPVVIDLSA
jgi:hypothetical protein